MLDVCSQTASQAHCCTVSYDSVGDSLDRCAIGHAGFVGSSALSRALICLTNQFEPSSPADLHRLLCLTVKPLSKTVVPAVLVCSTSCYIYRRLGCSRCWCTVKWQLRVYWLFAGCQWGYKEGYVRSLSYTNLYLKYPVINRVLNVRVFRS